jgi:hypothetical protein
VKQECSELLALVAARSLDVLEPNEKQRLEDHLAVCPGCPALAQHMASIVDLAAPRPAHAPRPETWDRLAARMAASPGTPPASRLGRVLRFTCQCGTPYTLADHLAGRTFRCTKCNATITIPAAPPAVAPPPAAAPGYAPPGYAPPGYAPPGYAPPAPVPTTSDSGLLVPDSDSDIAKAPAKASDSGKLELMPDEDAPTVDPDRSAPAATGKAKKTGARKSERLELKEELDLMAEDQPTADPDRDDVKAAKAAKGAAKKTSARAPAKGSGGVKKPSARTKKPKKEDSNVTWDCPGCGETIARAASECPHCGVPLRGGKGGMSDAQKKLVSQLGMAAGAIVGLVAIGLVVKMLASDSGGGAGTGGKGTKIANSKPKTPDPPKPPVEDPKPPVPEKKPDPRPMFQEDPNKKEDPKPTDPKPTDVKQPEQQDQSSDGVPDGPNRSAILDLRDARDVTSVEKAATALAGASGFTDAAVGYLNMKGLAPALKGRIARAFLAAGTVDQRKARLDTLWAYDDPEILIPAIEASAELEGADALKNRVGTLHGRSREAMQIGDAYSQVIADPELNPDSISLSLSTAKNYMGQDKDLSARMGTLLLVGGDGAGLTYAADAFLSSSLPLRKAAQRGLEKFLGKKGEKDATKDPDGARAEWLPLVSLYGPLREKLAAACDDGSSKSITSDQLAAIVDARVYIVANRQDVIKPGVLPLFLRDAAAKTGSAGSAFAFLLPKLCQGASEPAGMLNAAIDALNDDSRLAAPGLIQGALRAYDSQCAEKAVRALDKVVSYSDAVCWPDLETPFSGLPKGIADSGDPASIIVAGLFRGKHDVVEKLAFECKKQEVSQQALARLASVETEKRLLNVLIGKDKLPPGADATFLIQEVTTRTYIHEVVKHLSSSKDYSDAAYNNLVGSVERACAPSQGVDLVKLAEIGREKGNPTFVAYLQFGAKAAGGSDDAKVRNNFYTDVKSKLGNFAKPAPKNTGKTDPKAPPPPPPPPTPGPPPIVGDQVKNAVEKAYVECAADESHKLVAQTIDAWVNDAKTSKGAQKVLPTDDELNRFLRTAHSATAADDQKLVTKCFECITYALAGDQPRFRSFVIRCQLKLNMSQAVDRARAEIGGGKTIQSDARGESSCVLGRFKDVQSVDNLKANVDALCQSAKGVAPNPQEGGTFAGLAMIDPREGGAAATKFLGAVGNVAGVTKNVPGEVLEGCFFALAKSTQNEDMKVLEQWVKNPDPDVRYRAARGIAYAVRSPGGCGAGSQFIERLRVDPNPLVRAEAAIAAMESSPNLSTAIDGAMALEDVDAKTLNKPRASLLHLAATGEGGETTTLFLDLCRSIEKATKKSLDARPNMNLGRTREVIREARHNTRH